MPPCSGLNDLVKIDPMVGAKVSGYRLESVLGRGGMSVVYLAEQVALGRKVALKLLSPELAEDPDFRDRAIASSCRKLEAPARSPGPRESNNLVQTRGLRRLPPTLPPPPRPS